MTSSESSIVADDPVINASPWIFFSRGRQLDLLHAVCGDVLMPETVAVEVRRKGPSDPSVAALDATSWLRVVAPVPMTATVLAWDLGDGESSVLSWALAHPGAEAILDDLAARRCAAALGVPVRGTLGIVLAARRRGLIPAARPVVESMRQAGMYLSDAVLDRALALVGE